MTRLTYLEFGYLTEERLFVIFDEDEFFDGKKVGLDDNLAVTLDEYIHQVSLPMQASRNEVILQG
jgi:hypothetical protein